MSEPEDPLLQDENAKRRVDTRLGARDDALRFLPRGGDLLYRQEIESYLLSFCTHCDALEDKVRHMPKVWQDIQQIWQREGFLHPSELTLKLLQGQLDEAEPVEKRAEKEAFIRQVLDQTYQPESLTGTYESKQNAALITSLAHLYAQSDIAGKVPMTMLEGDFSNMSGTNQFLQKQAEKAAQPGEEVPGDTGHRKTDAAARVVANVALQKLENHIAEKTGGKGKVFALRTGGDELRIIVAGDEQGHLERFLEEQVHPAIESVIAQADIQRQEHPKHRGKKEKNGFGLSFGALDMGQDNAPTEMIAVLDTRIEAAKERTGYLRLGALPPKFEQQVQEAVYQTLLHEGMKREEALNLAAEAGRNAVIEAKNSGTTLAAQRKAILDSAVKHGVTAWDVAMQQSDYSEFVPEPQRQVGNALLPETRLPFEDPHSSAIKTLEARMKAAGITEELPENEKRIMLRVLEGYQAIDPVTRVQMPRDLPEQAALFAQDAARLKIENAHAQLLDVEFGNTGGFNKLSHLHADAVLREEAQILTDVLKKHNIGFSPQEGAHPDASGLQEPIYHNGGGRFTLLIPAIRMDAAGNMVPVTHQEIYLIQAEIAQATIERINQREMRAFFAERGLAMPAETPGNIDPTLKNPLMGDVQHSVRGAAESGVQLVMAHAVLVPELRGGEQVNRLAQKTRALSKQMAEAREAADAMQQEGSDGRRTQTAGRQGGNGSQEAGANPAGSAGDLSQGAAAGLPAGAAGAHTPGQVEQQVAAIGRLLSEQRHLAETYAQQELDKIHRAQQDAKKGQGR